MGKRKSRWSDPNKQAMLEELAALQLSASEIGALLGTTRNSIIGRARRTGVNLWHPEKMELTQSEIMKAETEFGCHVGVRILLMRETDV